MLQFFRRYQQIFFLFTTVVIIISFSFFGTYDAISSTSPADQTAFTTAGGREVSRRELDDWVNFLNTDIFDSRETGAAWGANFFNDGVLRRDFLESGLAHLIAERDLELISHDLRTRNRNERHFKGYVHPQAKFISSESTWTYFAPELSQALDRVRSFEGKPTLDSFDARVQLHIAQQQFPASMLRQVLNYQQSQYDWLPEDHDLAYTDLRLFGYASATDWFGRPFVEQCAKFILNTAEVAQARGHAVSRQEAQAVLNRQTGEAFKALRDQGGILNPEMLAEEQLRLMNLDRVHAAKMWQQVLLFRRLFEEVAGTLFVDSLPYEQFGSFAEEARNVTRYRLPAALRLKNAEQLLAYQVYSEAVSAERNPGMMPPTQYQGVAQIKGSAPELLQKRYALAVQATSLPEIESTIGVKQTWAWETEDAHWAELQQQFPTLGIVSAPNADARFEALEALDSTTRRKVDAFARKQIAAASPHLITAALESADARDVSVAIPLAGGAAPLPGVENRDAFTQLLDQAELDAVPVEGQALYSYSPDSEHFYRIRVVARSDDWELMTLAEASKLGTLKALVDRRLEAYYKQIRGSDRAAFAAEGGRFKPLRDVRQEVIERQLSDVIKAVARDMEEKPAVDLVAQQRMRAYLQAARDQLIKGADADKWLAAQTVETGDDLLPPRQSLQDQWKLEKAEQLVRRSDGDNSTASAFDLELDQWSEVHSVTAGDLSFFQVQEMVDTQIKAFVSEKMDEARQLLIADARKLLAAELLEQFPMSETLPLVEEEEG